MKKSEGVSYLTIEFKNELKKEIDKLVKVYLAKNRKKFIGEYIAAHITKFMGDDRPLTSKEVMDMMQISRATLNRRIKTGKLKPLNPDERNYRFMKSDIVLLMPKS